jgi:hypothetical protein
MARRSPQFMSSPESRGQMSDLASFDPSAMTGRRTDTGPGAWGGGPPGGGRGVIMGSQMPGTGLGPSPEEIEWFRNRGGGGGGTGGQQYPEPPDVWINRPNPFPMPPGGPDQQYPMPMPQGGGGGPDQQYPMPMPQGGGGGPMPMPPGGGGFPDPMPWPPGGGGGRPPMPPGPYGGGITGGQQMPPMPPGRGMPPPPGRGMPPPPGGGGRDRYAEETGGEMAGGYSPVGGGGTPRMPPGGGMPPMAPPGARMTTSSVGRDPMPSGGQLDPEQLQQIMRQRALWTQGQEEMNAGGGFQKPPVGNTMGDIGVMQPLPAPNNAGGFGGGLGIAKAVANQYGSQLRRPRNGGNGLGQTRQNLKKRRSAKQPRRQATGPGGITA